METTDKKEMTFEEEKQDCLKELYGWDYARRIKTAPISENTRAALHVRGLVEDLQASLFSLHILLYGDYGTETSDKFVEAIRPVEAIANEYLIDSINENITMREFVEI